MLENPKDKPPGGESLSRWQSRTASEMQACLAGQALLFPSKGLECKTHPTPGAETHVFASFLFSSAAFLILVVYLYEDDPFMSDPCCSATGTRNVSVVRETIWPSTGVASIEQGEHLAFWAPTAAGKST